MKKVSVLTFWVLVIHLVDAQSAAPYTPMSNYTQPAPNVGALGKYADYPVSYYTGTPNISVPLYDVKDGAVSLPISLSYHASGIRVSEMASWVGLGWALNCGGMIARSVRGAPDEGAYNAQASPRGYFADSGLKQLPMLPYPVNGSIPNNNTPNSSEIRRQFLAVLSAGYADCEPDVFTFNFNGYTGKFVFDENRTPRLLTEQDVKISVNYAGSDFTSWKIITPDGTIYYFGENNMREVNLVSANSGLPDYNTLKPASWFLTRIVYPNSKDTVNFTYATDSYTYFDLGQETRIFGGIGDPSVRQACSFGYDDIAKTVYKTAVTGLRLTTIKSKNYTIVFSANTVRQDLKGTSYALDSVRVLNNQNQCIKQYLLSYSYFVSTSANNIPIYGWDVMAGDTSDCKRLKLVSVKEVSNDGLSVKPPYVFSYQETYQLPRRLSFDQDHWGYSNNYRGNANIRFTPLVSHTICLNSSMFGSFRDPTWPDMQSCSIKSIKDPLGVITNFEFEPHSASLYYPLHTVGGLRVHKITTTDSVMGTTQSRLFDYGQGANLYKVPNYLAVILNEFYLFTCSPTYGPNSYRGYGYNYMNCYSSAIRQSQSIVPLQDFQGNHIGYPMVKEIFGPNGEGGYKVYSYMADQLWANNSRLDMSNYTAFAYVTDNSIGNTGVGSGIFGNGRFNDLPPDSLVYCSPSYSRQLFPLAPDQVDFRRGQLLWEETYDSANTLISSKRNTYEEKYHENAWIRGFKLFRVTSSSTTSPVGLINGYNDALTYYKLRTGRTRLISDTTTTYKDGKTMSAIHRYSYEDTLHSLATSVLTINSLGDSILNKTYYSFDYNNSADPVFAKMKNRNMLFPVSTRTWKNNQLIGGSITKFADFASSSADTFINPIKMYALETSSPMTASQAAENVSFMSPYTTLIPNTSFIEKANFNFNGTTGRIIEQRLTNDKNQSMIWDNTLRLPIAQVDNAYINDVAYSSFETAETGNWTYSSASITTDATSPTGTKAYTISGGLSKSSLTSAQKYILSYWIKSGASVSITGGTQTNSITGRVSNNWTYHEITITGTTSISLSGSGSVDEVRLHPILAQMTTYTYDPLLRLIATCSPNNSISYYDYDSFNRLVDIKDQYGNVVKAFEYNYGQLSR
jgi:hypothetical protein